MEREPAMGDAAEAPTDRFDEYQTSGLFVVKPLRA
jgi:hypothetical protein